MNIYILSQLFQLFLNLKNNLFPKFSISWIFYDAHYIEEMEYKKLIMAIKTSNNNSVTDEWTPREIKKNFKMLESILKKMNKK